MYFYFSSESCNIFYASNFNKIIRVLVSRMRDEIVAFPSQRGSDSLQEERLDKRGGKYGESPG